MASTTSFNWETPDDTDLVKDGAAAIRTLGNSIDTSMTDLLGGTTGQVLAKASNTNMDFTWVAQDDSNAIQNAIVDAKGDLIAATAADTPARLAVGTNGQVLTADSTAATGMKWAAAASSSGPTFGANKSANQTLTGFTISKVTFTGTPKWDTDSCFDTTNSRFTPNKAGYYLITGTLYVAGSPIYLNIRKNGNDADDFGVGSSAGTYAPNTTSIWYLNGSTDYVEMWCYPNNASSQTALSYPNARFEGSFLRS